MKKSKLLLITAFLGLSIILGGCVPGPRVQGGPGVSLSDEKVFVAFDFFVYGMDIESRVVEWHFPDDSDNQIKFYAQPLVTDEFIYVGDVANDFHKINQETGQVEWTFSGAEGFFIGLAAEEDGVVYAPSNDGNLYAIDKDGTELWRFETEHNIWAQPQIDGDRIYVASMDHFIYAISKSDGEVLWAFEMNGAVIGTPVLSEDGRRLYAGSIGKEMVALATLNGELLWSFNANDELDSVWGNAIWVNGILYFADSSGQIYALDAETGEKVWPAAIDFSGTIIGGLTAIENGFVFGTQEGEIRAYDFEGGLLWTRSVEGEIFQAPVVNDNYLVVGTVNGDELVHLFDLTGNPIWSDTPEN